jgi:predicted porin
VVQEVVPESSAVAAGFQQGDEIKSINGEEVTDWARGVELIRAANGAELSFTVLRGGQSIELRATPRLTEVGVRAPVTKVISVWGNYFMGARSTASTTAVTLVQSATAAAGAADIKGFQLGTMYAFSKRTTAYGIYGTQDLKGTGIANGAKLDGTMYAVGLRHTF